MALCQSCRGILRLNKPTFVNNPKPGWNIRYEGRDGKDLEDEADAGCTLCTQVWKGLDDYQRHILSSPNCSGIACRVFSYMRTGSQRLGALHMYFQIGDDPLTWVNTKYTLVTGVECKSADDIQNRNNTRQVISQCKDWLNECMENHEICRSRIGGNEEWLPTRLLDTGAPGQAPSLRLVLSESLDRATTSYLALSHRWGQAEILTLKESNIDSLQENISLVSVPRTFQHAAVMTRALGYRYIWIDSLCIIQDSPGDWDHEAAFMGDVYSQADCVLAATGSWDGDGGLFKTRDPVLVAPVELEADWSSDQRTYSCIEDDFWETGVANAPLNQRGWVVQERMLAPRTLHFGDSQIFWECRDHQTCEVLPERIPQEFLHFGNRDGDGFKRWMQPEDSPDTDFNDPPGPYDPWAHIIEVYSRCKLTKAKDKFIAISGMAKKMQLVLEDEYVAGLWKKNLVNGLTWYVADGEQTDGSPSVKTERRPSWSWASVEGAISQVLDSDLEGNFVNILDVVIDPLGTDEYGELKNAFIILEGTLKRIQKPKFFYVSSLKICGTYHPDDVLKSESLDELYALPLRYYRRGADSKGLWGLVLAPMGEYFERVGFFKIEKDDDICSVGGDKPQNVAEEYGLSAAEPRQVIRLA
ncbi:hypothetical protein BP6252_05826 [Coleophoma cylindrospora]|uniref:Heterokaryon incompatibility domain-containing protein n=1 Tax=Coleophoma cylindrospora TaxID=1849047 RepID=A0A3D8RUP9_9HELO|nr:hypothetical protein BP6252_05826 [Coleophoma cylindrospora]